MKKFKKIASLVLAASMMAAMPVSMATTMVAYADETSSFTLTLNNTTVGHKYAVYQIFTGDVSGTDTKTLSNVKYGANYGGKTAGDEVPSTELSAITDADAFASSVSLTGDPVKTVDSAAGTTEITGLVPGYYLVVETTASVDVPQGETETKNILQIVGNTNVAIKSGTTTSEKKVKDVNDSVKDSLTDWQDSADYDIGDDVPFELKATVASDYANYDSYVLNFHDEQSDGLFFNNDATVSIDGNKINSGYEVVTTGLTDGCDFEVKFADLKNTSAKAGSVITVEYTSKLTGDKVVLGSTGNPNESYIEYSNKPGSNQTGTTPHDKVIVFTYQLTANKIEKITNADGTVTSQALTGAGFTLYKKNASGKYEAVGSEVKGVALTTFTWKGVDDGDYKLVETTTPTGYNTMKDLEFTITATHDTTSDNPTLTNLGATTLEGVTNPFSGDAGTGIISGDIENTKGSQLPTTGGMGTTILYVAGAILVICGAAVLVIKKRHEA